MARGTQRADGVAEMGAKLRSAVREEKLLVKSSMQRAKRPRKKGFTATLWMERKDFMFYRREALPTNGKRWGGGERNGVVLDLCRSREGWTVGEGAKVKNGKDKAQCVRHSVVRRKLVREKQGEREKGEQASKVKKEMIKTLM